MKNIGFFLSENSLFLEVQFSVYLNRRVFVMSIILASSSEVNFIVFRCHLIFLEDRRPQNRQKLSDLFGKFVFIFTLGMIHTVI